ncbi:GspE/PulE family protein [Phenylobacterium sp.]|uniref:GspE/PulE family protein n=1 Tax=Phenylobacterium sp. TaxID=1871053 RepID=UPI002E36094D|nr:ATPase, T2SS/T4P/T4SS family [Phenylobacterium sp.]HEX3365612.1 ATPase, T2SS/T4P/T4SS family [Phenylobacterium sp.]
MLQALVDQKIVDLSAVAQAELISGRTGQPVEQVLNQLGSLSDDDLVDAYAAVCGCEVWEPARRPTEVDLSSLGVSVDFLRRARMLPIQQSGKTLVCAACDPLDDEALTGLVFATGCDLKLLAARPSDWTREFERAFGTSRDLRPQVADERRLERAIDLVTDKSVEGNGARLVAAAFEAAMASGASDIHFEPTRNDLRIRLRVDGRLVDHQVVSADLAAPAVSRVKVIANLNLGERRLPQDGRTTFVVHGRQVDVRVATSPTVFGESAVLRILDRSSVPLDLDTLGLSGDIVQVLRRAAKAAHGLFLITGPTGSGKTTTLYALLQTFVGSGKKVLSVEDPVEYHFEHVSQTQVAAHLGLTFAAALRSFLRQDPDVILVGEIRDPETAAVAIQAAMTGHFVLASVHANDALAVLPRLQDMGLEPYQLAAGFRGAVAQRLVRRLCPRCAVAGPPTEAERLFARSVGVEPPDGLAHPVGCTHCKRTGFKGRIPISEAFQANDDLLRAVADREPARQIEEIARRAGLLGMASDGFDKAIAGVTTVEEVAAAIHG